MRPTSTDVLCIAAGLALFACSSSAATERSETERQRTSAPLYASARLDEQLSEAADALRTRGFTDDGSVVRSFVVEHAAHVTEAPLRTSSCYVVAAVGSSAMRALSLQIYDSDGLEVASSEGVSPRVALRYCPAQSGTYYVSARAATGSGLVALRRFRGPTGIAVRVDDVFRDSVPAEPRRATP